MSCRERCARCWACPPNPPPRRPPPAAPPRPSHACAATLGAGGPALDGSGNVTAAIAAATAALEPGAVQTYGSYWRVLRDGITLPAEWSDERILAYAEDLAKVNAEHHLNLQLPADILACPRIDDPDPSRRRVVVHPGHGDLQLRRVTQFEIMILKKWVKANALANAAEQNRQRAAAGKPPLRRDGLGAEENFVAAARCLYTAAAANGLVPPSCSPTCALSPPRAAPASRGTRCCGRRGGAAGPARSTRR